jgi:hypothetical protein
MISAEDIATWQSRDDLPDDPPGRGGTAYRTVPMSDTEDKIAWLRAGGDCDPPCKSMVADHGCTCALAADALAEVERLREQLRSTALDALAIDGQAMDLQGEVARLRAENAAITKDRDWLLAKMRRLRAEINAAE